MRMSRRRVNSVINKAERILKQDYSQGIEMAEEIPAQVKDMLSLFNLILTHKIEVTDK